MARRAHRRGPRPRARPRRRRPGPAAGDGSDRLSTYAITGSAGGIGGALAERLRGEGHTVIGVDRHDADVVADLATAAGRAAMVDAIAVPLDGVVAAAGLAEGEPATVVSVNYFGAVATIEGLRPRLRAGGSAVAISSNSATTAPGTSLDLVERCLAGDEPGAREVAGAWPYAATKLALGRWVRRQAPTPAWAGADVRLNAVAPGLVATPMTEANLELYLSLDAFPIPLARPATPAEIAALLAFLLSPDAGYFCGSVLTVDGGTEAALRPDDWPAPLPEPPAGP